MRTCQAILLVLWLIYSQARCQCPAGETCDTAGILPVLSDVSMYKFCLAAGATPSCYKCPDGEAFNVALSKCASSGPFPTTDSGTGTTTDSGTITTANPVCSQEPSCTREGLVPHQRCSCSSFYTCTLNTKGRMILQEYSCVGEFLYNPETRRCEDKNIVACPFM